MIVHLVYNDKKFIDNYINFFNCNYSDLNNYYVLYGRGTKNDDLKFSNHKNILVINRLYKINKMNKAYNLFKTADKVIISGIFGIEYFLFLIRNSNIWNKIYLHFWGGDFYQFRNVSKNRYFMEFAIKKCKSLIMIEEDYKVLSKIFRLKKKYIKAIDPCYDYDINKYKKYVRYINNDQTVKFLVGNSATKENQHIEILTKLLKFIDEDILIYCPLSYGDMKYRNRVIKYGKEKFGNKFIPLVDFITYDEYIALISSCNIAIYNHNRQQAFGNIIMSLALGLKVFINRENTYLSLFSNIGCHVFSIFEIENGIFNEIVNYDNTQKIENYDIISNLKNDVIRQWEFLYTDNI